MIPENHPRYRSLKVREHMALCAKAGILSLEGLTAHGRGEAFDYLLGEETSNSAYEAERVAAALIMTAKYPVISVNGNTAALCADSLALLQKVQNTRIEVNLFHRTAERIDKITKLLTEAGCIVIEGPVQRFIPLEHDRGLCHADGIAAADVILVPLEDGDRASALISLGKKVIAIDLNPLSRTTQTATLPIIDEVTRAIVNITTAMQCLTTQEAQDLIKNIDGKRYIKHAIMTINTRLLHVLD
jgi:4-phosphopantoate--beta-alanine ligase